MIFAGGLALWMGWAGAAAWFSRRATEKRLTRSMGFAMGAMVLALGFAIAALALLQFGMAAGWILLVFAAGRMVMVQFSRWLKVIDA